MAPTAVHVLVFDDFADWEPALALAELRGDAGRRIMSVSFGAASVTSMGGLQVKPDCELDEVHPAQHASVHGGDIEARSHVVALVGHEGKKSSAGLSQPGLRRSHGEESAVTLDRIRGQDLSVDEMHIGDGIHAPGAVERVVDDGILHTAVRRIRRIDQRRIERVLNNGS